MHHDGVVVAQLQVQDGGGGGGRRAAAVAASLPAVWTMSSSTYRGNVYIQGVPEILVYTFI